MPVDAAPTTVVSRVVGLHAADLVAEEAGRFVTSVGDQGLLLREFQLEVIAQESLQSDLDFCGFGLRTGKPIRVANVVQSPVDWVGMSGEGSWRTGR